MTPAIPSTKSPAFLRAIDFVLPHEESFARGHWGDEAFVAPENVSGDKGGVTKFGIDSRSHPGVKVKDLTRDQAIDIYWAEWIAHRLDLLPDRLAIAAFDVYVNGGTPISWLQSAYNSTHLGERGLVIDNQLGPKTLEAIRKCNQDVILRAFFFQRNTRFRLLAQKPSQAKFLEGWLVRDSDLEKFLNVYEPPNRN